MELASARPQYLVKIGWRKVIKDNQKLLNRLHVVIDALVIIFSYTAAWYLRFKSGIFELDPWFLSLQEYMKALLIIVPGYLILYYAFQLYTPKRVQGRRYEAWQEFCSGYYRNQGSVCCG